MRIRKNILAGVCAVGLALCACGCGETVAEPLPESRAESQSEAPESEAPDRPYMVEISPEVIHKTGIDPAAASKQLPVRQMQKQENGSYLLYFTAEELQAAQQTMKASMDQALEALSRDNKWDFVSQFSADSHYENIKILSRTEAYFAPLDRSFAPCVYIPALLYRTFTGQDTENFVQTFTVYDADGETVLDHFQYPAEDPLAASAPEEP